jgi:hypothetical protein
LHEQRSQVLVAALGDLAQDRAISLDSCFGTSPSQAPKSRPWLKPAPLPIAATTALAMIGPTPGTVISLWQLSSCSASARAGTLHSRRQTVHREPAHAAPELAGKVVRVIVIWERDK